jgi:hypothetical protein
VVRTHREMVREVVRWGTSSTPASTLYARGADDHRDRSAARKILREAPLEQVEQIIDELPAERKQAVAAAAGDSYAKARQEHNEREARAGVLMWKGWSFRSSPRSTKLCEVLDSWQLVA